MNRDNGALIGFYNTSYITPQTNWTDYEIAEVTKEEDGDSDHDDDQLIVEST